MRSQLQSLVKQMQDGGILYSEAVEEFRKVFLASMLERHNGNQCRAARALGIHRNTLSRNLADLKITVKPSRGLKPHLVKSERQTA